MDHRLIVNGAPVETDAAPTTRLIDVLRDDLGLTGTKDSCGRGDCGSCTVLIGDRAVLACLTLALRVNEPIRTIEGVAEQATGLREAFADHGGMQCGYCTPGLIVRCSQVDRMGEGEAARAALAGNFCRCTGYNGVLAALEAREIR